MTRDRRRSSPPLPGWGVMARIAASAAILHTVLLPSEVASKPVSRLTPENYDRLTRDKTVFLRFFVPTSGSCSYCDSVGELWEKLADAWDGRDPSALVAEVDCTLVDNLFVNDLCTANDIRSLLTLKYGDPLALQTMRWYEWDELKYTDLAGFAKEHLQPICTVRAQQLCSAREKSQIERFRAMSVQQLDGAIVEEEQKLVRVQDLDAYLEDLKDTTVEIHNAYLQDANKEFKKVRWAVDLLEFLQDPAPVKKKTFPIRPKNETNGTSDPPESTCSPINLASCDAESRDLIAMFQSYDSQKIIEYLKAEKARLTKIQNEFDARVDVMLATSRKIARDLEDEADIIDGRAKATGYYLMQAVRAAKEKKWI